MANIQNELNNIKNAMYGKDVRSSIHDGIDAINNEVESTTGRQVDLENTFDQLVINAGNSNAEIVDARVKNDGTSYSKLGDRLDAVDSQLAHIENDLAIKYTNIVIDDKSKSFDNTLILQNEINHMSENGGGVIYLPKGIIYINRFTIKDNVSLIGCGMDKTIIQLVLPTERYYGAIGLKGNNTLSNFSVKDDITNNQIPSTVDTDHKDNVQSLLLCTGSNITLQNIGVYNSSTWAFCCDESALTERRNNVKILNCYFEWNKREYYLNPFDVSQIYVTCETMEFKNNIFVTKSPKFSRTVFDIRGFDVLIEGNYVKDYVQPLLLQNSYYNLPNINKEHNHIVRNNTFLNAKIGTMIYSYKKGFNNVILDKAYNNLTFENNFITINTYEHTSNSGSQLIAGFTFSPPEKGDFDNLCIKNNTFKYMSFSECKTDKGLISGIHLYSGFNVNLRNVIIENNLIEDFPYTGINIGLPYNIKNNSIIKNIKIKNNDFINNGGFSLGTNFDYHFNTNILIYDNFIEDLYIVGNTFSYNKDNHAVSTISHINYDNNTVKNIYISKNLDLTGTMGETTTRECHFLAGKDTGLPMEFSPTNRINVDYNLLHTCTDIENDKISYYKGDIIITNNGIYKANGCGTTGKNPVSKIVSIHGTNSFIVDDISTIKPGDFISMSLGVYTRVVGIVGNIVYVQYGMPIESYVGYSIKNVRQLTKII